MGKTQRLMVVATLAALLPGCVPVSENPLKSQDGKKAQDAGLLGAWGDEDQYMLVMQDQQEEGKLRPMKVAMVDKNCYLEWEATTVEIGKRRYLNLKSVGMLPIESEDDKKLSQHLVSGYVFAWYEIKEGVMSFAFANQDAIQKAIEAGDIKGKIGKPEKFVTITDSSEKVAEWIEKADHKKVFENKREYHRLTATSKK